MYSESDMAVMAHSTNQLAITERVVARKFDFADFDLIGPSSTFENQMKPRYWKRCVRTVE